MKKTKVTSMKSLRKRKAALVLEIEQQKQEIINSVESIVWPLRVFRKYKATAENIAGNTFFAIGMQFAQSVLNAAWKRKKSNEEHEDYGIADFLKQVADDFITRFTQRKQTGEES